MIAREQDVRDRFSFEELGPRIMGMFKQPLLEALFDAGRFIAHDTRKQPHDGIEKRERRRFTPRQHKIAKADPPRGTPADHPLVHPFEPPADNDGPRPWASDLTSPCVSR